MNDVPSTGEAAATAEARAAASAVRRGAEADRRGDVCPGVGRGRSQ